MPKENKKRGRRAGNKRKLDNDETEEKTFTKRQKHNSDDQTYAGQYVEQDYVPLDNEDALQPTHEFVGLLDEEEQEYFRKAGELLELNQFDSPDERIAFVNSVFEQAENKELKLASSQSASRVLERLVHHSSPLQIKHLFRSFSTHFVSLFQHRFASHCCEALFLAGATVVATEMEADNSDRELQALVAQDKDKTMFDCFVGVVQEVEENLGFLMADTFGSHPLRVLLLVLAGEPIETKSHKSVTFSRRKEHVTVVGQQELRDRFLSEPRKVPDSFKQALKTAIQKSVAGLDSLQLQSLTTHRVGNPMLQLLLRLELKHVQSDDSDISILRTLLPDTESEGPTASYVQNMLYDTVGSRLLEVIVEFAPAKTFKFVYKSFIRERLLQLCRQDSPTYVVCKALNRIGPEDLQHAIKTLGPEFSTLIQLDRLHVIRTLLERAVAREVPMEALSRHFRKTYGNKSGPWNITKLLRLDTEVDAVQDDTAAPKDTTHTNQKQDSGKLHASLLAQSILSTPTSLATSLAASLSELSPETLIHLATSPVYSHVIIAALVPSDSITPHPSSSTTTTKTTTSQPPPAAVAIRRTIISKLNGHYAELGSNPAGSRVVDAVWDATPRMPSFIRETVAEELGRAEQQLRGAAGGAGRKVWQKWDMDLWKRRRVEWIRRCKVDQYNAAASDDQVAEKDVAGKNATGNAMGGGSIHRSIQGTTGAQIKLNGHADGGRQLTALEKARMRHYRQKTQAPSFSEAVT